MARPLRLEFAGALYHVTSRSDRREDISVNDEDRHDVEVPSSTCTRNWIVHASCQMSNYYHLLLKTQQLALHEILD
jgi:putative transposase